MLKAEECLAAEEARVQNYLHISTKPKLLEQARCCRSLQMLLSGNIAPSAAAA